MRSHKAVSSNDTGHRRFFSSSHFRIFSFSHFFHFFGRKDFSGVVNRRSSLVVVVVALSSSLARRSSDHFFDLFLKNCFIFFTKNCFFFKNLFSTPKTKKVLVDTGVVYFSNGLAREFLGAALRSRDDDRFIDRCSRFELYTDVVQGVARSATQIFCRRSFAGAPLQALLQALLCRRSLQALFAGPCFGLKK